MLDALEGKKGAFNDLYSCAGSGSAEAQYYLALYYKEVKGVGPDSDYAYWMKKAKDNGDDAAEEALESLIYVVNYEKGIIGTQTNVKASSSTTIIMNKRNSVFWVPCKINGLKADFVFDTGASIICLSSLFAKQLIEQGLISESDVIGNSNVTVADGRTQSVTNINIKDIEIGGLHIKNVRAAIVERQNVPLLLGQSAIEKLGKITIDGYKLIIHR